MSEPVSDEFQKFGGRPSGRPGARYLPMLKGVLMGGSAVGLVIYAATIIFPDGFRPGDVAGKSIGAAERHEIIEKADAKVEFEKRLAEAVAKVQADAQGQMQIAVARASAEAQAKMQIDVETNRQVLAERTQGNALASVFASALDVACIGSKVVQAYGASNTGRDWQDRAQTTAGATCGAGNIIRDDIARSQTQAVVAATTARGLPQAIPMPVLVAPRLSVPEPSPAVERPRAVPSPATPQQASSAPTTPVPATVKAPPPSQWRTAIRSLEDIYAINEPSEHFTAQTVSEAGTHAWRTLPKPVYSRVIAGLGYSDHDKDVFVERARIAMAFLADHR